MKKHIIKNLINIIVIVVFPIFLTQCSLFYPSAKKTNAKFISQAPFDVIIVPGYPHDTADWSQIVEMRILWATDLYKRGLTKNIMFSGSAVYSPYVESKVMARYAEALGVPSKNIFTEESALHSTENLYYSYVRSKEIGFKKIALASDPFQTNGLRIFRKTYHLDVALLPIVFKELKDFNQKQPDINVADLFIEDFIPLTEKENFGERLLGTFGKNIRWKEEDLNARQAKRIRKRGMVIPKKNIPK